MEIHRLEDTSECLREILKKDDSGNGWTYALLTKSQVACIWVNVVARKYNNKISGSWKSVDTWTLEGTK